MYGTPLPKGICGESVANEKMQYRGYDDPRHLARPPRPPGPDLRAPPRRARAGARPAPGARARGVRGAAGPADGRVHGRARLVCPRVRRAVLFWPGSATPNQTRDRTADQALLMLQGPR